MPSLGCRCGDVRLKVEGPHIASVECLCSSCQKAAQVLEALPGAGPILDGKGATPFVLLRKDRVAIVAGQDRLKAHRLTDDADTRRVIAACCNTPVFLEMKGGHWLSLYAALWPETDRPAVELRTMTGARDDLPDDVPNLRTHSLGFYGRLFVAWVRMGFRNPRFPDNGALHVEDR
ncbi:DUF6151 family protein [Limimaricola sp. G21655-S1]|uniref:GFA family protein n=1 Tax=Limimaricola sp. G21655-S1 TaxID=3014768 RepID=UPI0022AEBEC4|nr:DUF6151 family protein [Limimaricola sp. G21655-S1]MCZ4262691.1 DUF6151 family protein [Limimaricola sp. G21655-S1]